MSRLGLSFCLLVAGGVSGCMVGPDFQRPTLDPGAGYIAGQEAAPKKAPVQALAYGADVPGRWWELFRNKPLDTLMQQAIMRRTPTPPNGALLEAPVSGLFQLTIPARASSASLSNSAGSAEISPTARP